MVSIKTFIALSTGTKGYKFTVPYETCTNVFQLMNQCLFLFKVGCIISTKYLDVPRDAAPIVDTMVLIK